MMHKDGEADDMEGEQIWLLTRDKVVAMVK